VTAKTVADLRALSTWPDGLVLSIHVDLDPPIERREGGAGILIQPSKRRFPPPSLPAVQKWPLSPPRPSLKILEPETRDCQRKRKPSICSR